MVDTWIVFGGWALGTKPLEPLFGPEAVYIDSNPIMPSLVKGGVLAPDWQEILAESAAPLVPKVRFGIAGWSTGALLAYALGLQIKPTASVFISATPSFCRRPGFPYGQKEMVLKAMREQLAVNPVTVVDKFYTQCGVDQPVVPEQQRADHLTAGLIFLQHATLFPIERLACPSLFLHGKDDAIIPAQAGAFLCHETGGTFAEYPGPHAFFMAQHETVTVAIKRFLSQGAA
jgi:pimeloyl-ACP methyl ester carboxylesterase